ncbi:hypothetical protein H5407_17450 [Mitsuaria sp. WAJ17]|uniref:CAP domain-containing protein n=1 Tax=Mitsuaria sp. WAJ17 TaxID=2761452 RepID=UPI00160434F8|nr:CAP domain-containing protein [Mitsuaria sp. WAJ17]MBB2487018.1 hypothetical protein [Mitsuaria sp. WAJ17]
MRRTTFLQLLRAGLLAGLATAATAQEAPRQPPGCDPDVEQALALANALRQEARHCGARAFEAARPLRWSGALQTSARRFAAELAARGELSHQGLSSPTLRERVRDTGYVLRAVGENLAAGPLGLDEAFSLWTASEEHCANLMRADFEELGLACVSASGRYERFWVLHLAAPARRF